MTSITEITSFKPFGSPLPPEIGEECYRTLTISELLLMRTVSRDDKEMIDHSPRLQGRISHEYLLQTHSKSNIPLLNLNYYLVDNTLAVEINNNFTLWKVNEWFIRTIPWINHLIIKDALAPQLNELFTHLKKNSRLISLCLIDCEVDANSQNHLRSLLKAQKNPVFYLGSLTPVNCELELPVSNDVILIDATKIKNFSLESILGKESDVIALKEFEKAVSNNTASNQEVLEGMDALNPIIQSKIIASIWHSCLMVESNIFDSPSIIHQKTHAFVEKNPHHPALIAATHKQLNYISS